MAAWGRGADALSPPCTMSQQMLCGVAWGTRRGPQAQCWVYYSHLCICPPPGAREEGVMIGKPLSRVTKLGLPKLTVLPCSRQTFSSPSSWELSSLLHNWVSAGDQNSQGVGSMSGDTGPGVALGRQELRGLQPTPPSPKLRSWLEGELLRRLPSPWQWDSPDTSLAPC